MRVFVDEQLVQGLPESLTVSDAVATCAGKAEAQGRLVVGVVADGMPLTDFGVTAPVHELWLTTAEPARLLSDAFDAARQTVDECRSLQTATADALMEGRIEDGTRGMQSVMDGWARVHQGLIQTDDFGRRAAPEAFMAASACLDARAMLEQLAACLRDLKTAIGSEDWAAAADVLGVELIEQCEQWGTRLEKCRDAAVSVLEPG